MPKSVSTGFSLLNGARRAVVFWECVLTENPFRTDDLNGIYMNASHISSLKHHDRSRVRFLSCRKAVDKRRGRMGPGLNREVNEQRASFLTWHFTHIAWGQLVIHNQSLRLLCLMKAAVRSENVQAPDTTACRCLPRRTHARTESRHQIDRARAFLSAGWPIRRNLKSLLSRRRCFGIPASRHRRQSPRLQHGSHSSRTPLRSKIESPMTASIFVTKEPE